MKMNMRYAGRTMFATALAVIVPLGAACDRDEPIQNEHAGHDHREQADHDDHAHEGAGAEDDHAELDAEYPDTADDHKHDAHDDDDPEAHHDHDDERVIRIDAATLDEFGVVIERAAGGSLQHELTLSGEVELNPDRIGHVAARAPGIVREVRAAVGERVRAGDLLAVLDSPSLADAKAEYLSRMREAALSRTDLERIETIHANTIRLLEVIEANPNLDELRSSIEGLDIGASRGELINTFADYHGAQAVYEREKALFEDQISSESEFLQAESELKKAWAAFQAARDDLAFANRRELDGARRAATVAQVGLDAAERRLHALGLDETEVDQIELESDVELSRYEVQAPIDGMVIERHLVRGESVDESAQMFVVADLSSVWIKLTVYQKDLPAIEVGDQAHIIGAHGVAEATNPIDYISPIIDESTRTTTARVVLPNEGGEWRPGMFVIGTIERDGGASAVVVPRRAVQRIEDEDVVFVVTAEGIEPRRVRLGARSAERVEVLSGLEPGDEYVAAGALAMKTELNKAALEHAGHVH